MLGFGPGYLIGYCAAQFLTRPPTLGDSHFLIFVDQRSPLLGFLEVRMLLMLISVRCSVRTIRVVRY